MSSSELVILFNLALLLFGQLAIINSISKKKQVLLILLVTAVVSAYSGYLALGQLEGTTLKFLLIILSVVLWLAACYQLSPLYFSITQKMKIKYPTKMIMRLLKDLVNERSYHTESIGRDSIRFSMGNSIVDVDVYSFLRSKYLEVNVSSDKRGTFFLFITLLVLPFVPLSYSLYIENPYLMTVTVYNYVIPLHVAYFSAIFLIALWLVAKHIRTVLIKDVATVWSDIVVRIKKLDEAMRVVEGIERARKIAEQMRREKIRKALEIARGIEAAKELIKKKEEQKEKDQE